MANSAYISTLENLIKPIANPNAGAFIRLAISGYFLNVSNISNINTSSGGGSDLIFRLLVITPNPRVVAPGEIAADRSFTTGSAIGTPVFPADPTGVANNQVIFDVTGGSSFGQTAVGELTFLGTAPTGSPISGASSLVYWTDLFTLEIGQTGQVAILPNLDQPPRTDGTVPVTRGRLEIRGFVGFGIRKGGAAPTTSVLLSPEQRGTFIPRNVPPNQIQPADVSQLNTDLPTANASGAKYDIARSFGTTLPANVQNFATTNGIANVEILPFVDLLEPIV